VSRRRPSADAPVATTVMILLPGLAMIECEVVGYKSGISLVDQMRRSFQLRGIRADVSLRGDVVVVRGRLPG